MQKEVLITYKDGEFVFPVADGSATLSRTHSKTGIHRKEREFEAENLKAMWESFNLKKQKMTRKLGKTCGLFKEISFVVTILNREFNYTCRKKNHSPTPLKYIDVIRSTHTDLDEAEEKRIDDYWNVDGSRNLSDSWTGFTRFTLRNETPPKGYMWSGCGH